MMSETTFPATHSILSAPALQEQVLSAYSLGTVYSCRFFHQGVNDTYFVHTDNDKYMLRISRHGLHAQEHILFEIDALNHLHSKGVPVAAPIEKHDGSFVTALHATEGERYAVLFQKIKRIGKRSWKATPRYAP